MKQKRTFVAVIDVLGFSSRITKENGLDETYNLYKKLVQIVNTQSTTKVSRGWVKGDEFQPFHKFFDVQIFSDSMVIFPNSRGLEKKEAALLEEMFDELPMPDAPNRKSPREIVKASSRYQVFDMYFRSLTYLFQRALKNGIPLRGAVAYGNVIINKGEGIFLGKPIVDAHKLEEAQDWLGIAIHPSCYEKFESLNSEILKFWFSEHSPKVKSDYTEKIKYVLNWAQNENIEIDPQIIVNLKQMRNDSKDEEVINKYDNTINYVEWLIEKQNIIKS